MWLGRWLGRKLGTVPKAFVRNNWEVSRQVPLSIPPNMALLLELDFWNI